MTRLTKGMVVAVLALAIAGVIVARMAGRQAIAPDEAQGAADLPTLLEVGSDKCVPCKMMKPILDELKSEYAGRFNVELLDYIKMPGVTENYGVQIIPTQLFMDAQGRELARHEGFIEKEKILEQWAALGYPMEPAKTGRPAGWLSGLFGSLSRALEGMAGLALAAAFLWGILSVLLSPCHLSSIPLVIAFISGQGRVSTARAFSLASLFSIGILITIGLIGLITALAGSVWGAVGGWANIAVSIIFFVIGLYLFDVIPMPWSGPAGFQTRRKGLAAALALGLIFGVAVGPCTFAYMAPLLGVTFKVAATRLPYAIGLLALYGLGHCSVIVLAGTWVQWVQRYLNWTEASRGAMALKRVCGLLVLAGGLYLLYVAP